MKGSERLAHVASNLNGSGGIKRARAHHDILERLARDVVVYGDKAVGHLVGGGNLGQARAVVSRERRPHGTVGPLRRHLLAYEGAGVLDGHELRSTVGVSHEHALDTIGIVDAHGMHDLLAIQPGNPPPIFSHNAPPRVRAA